MEQYQAPQSQVAAQTAVEYSDPKVFGVSGRIGRLRFIAYSILSAVIVMFVVGILAAVIAPTAGPELVMPIAGLGYLLLIIYNFMIAIQRSHDMNLSGWFSIIVVLFAIIFWFVPGTKGPNNYGNEPKPNHAGIYITVILVPIIYIGILAAIAIPAYQGYIERAQQLQQEQGR